MLAVAYFSSRFRLYMYMYFVSKAMACLKQRSHPIRFGKNDVIRVCFEKESPNLLTYHIRAISVRDLYFLLLRPLPSAAF